MHCFRCSFGGSLVRLIQTLSNVPKLSAIRILQGDKISPFEMLDFRLIEEEFSFDDEEEDELREIELPHGFVGFDESKKGTIYHDYLKSRGVSLSYAKRNGWGYSHVGFVANRIIIPMYINDRLVFWQARDVLGENHPDWGNKKLYKKTRNPTGVSARKVLYNYDVAKDHDEIILVEGFIDAVKAGENAVAANGKKLHSSQVELLTRSKARSVVLLFDPDAFDDARGVKPSSVFRAASMLKSFFSVDVVRLPQGRDAGSYSHDDLRSIIKKTRTNI
jgi:DNA primase